MRNGVSYLVYMYTLGAGRILIKSIIIVCSLNLMAWKASFVHRTGENETRSPKGNGRSPESQHVIIKTKF